MPRNARRPSGRPSSEPPGCGSPDTVTEHDTRARRPAGAGPRPARSDASDRTCRLAQSRLRDRDLGAEARPRAGPAGDAEGAPERLDAIGEAAKPRAAVHARAADAVVRDHHDQPAAGDERVHGGPGRARVLGDVGERLGDQVVGGDLDGGGRTALQRDGDVHGQRRAGRDRAQRGAEPTVGEHGGVDAVGQVAQLAQRGAELLPRGGHEPLLLGPGREPSAERAELQRERHEPLLGAVVEVALEPAALAVPRLDDPRAAPRAARRLRGDVLDEREDGSSMRPAWRSGPAATSGHLPQILPARAPWAPGPDPSGSTLTPAGGRETANRARSGASAVGGEEAPDGLRGVRALRVGVRPSGQPARPRVAHPVYGQALVHDGAVRRRSRASG